MLNKVTFICESQIITGKLDIPKIKKTFGRKHYGVLALLNHPKLASDWFLFRKDLLCIHDAKVRDFCGNLIASRESLLISPDSIFCAYEDDAKERATLERNFNAMIHPKQRLAFKSINRLYLEGDIISDVNEVALTKGNGFLSIANVCLELPHQPGASFLMPFVAINHSRMAHFPKPQLPLTQLALERHIKLAQVS